MNDINWELWGHHSPPDLDLGCGRYGWFTCWKPDRDLNPQYADLPDVEKFGLIIQHEGCIGHITFDSEVSRRVMPDAPRWKVISMDPLHVEPSIKSPDCHGWIRGGKWVQG